MFFTAMYHLPVYLPSLYRRKRWLTNVPQTTKIPNCRSSWGFWVRYKGLPECPSICELCVYCSSCTYTLSHLRLSQGMSQTAGNQNLIPAVLDCSLCCSTQKREIKLPFLFPILYVPDSIFHCVHPMHRFDEDVQEEEPLYFFRK